MSTTLHDGEEFSVTRFHGGAERGVCVQIGAATGSVQLRVTDALALARLLLESLEPWDGSHIKQPGWHHVEAAFIEGAREARANPDADEATFRRAADGYTKRVFEEVDPVSEAALRTASWELGGHQATKRPVHGGYPGTARLMDCSYPDCRCPLGKAKCAPSPTPERPTDAAIERCRLLDELILAWRDKGNSEEQKVRRINARRAIEAAWPVGVGASTYTGADVAAAHTEGYKLGLAQKDREREQLRALWLEWESFDYDPADLLRRVRMALHGAGPRREGSCGVGGGGHA